MNGSLTGTCDCGASVQRDRLDGFGAEFFNAMPFRCSDCIDETDRQEQAAIDEERRAASRTRRRYRVANSGIPAGLTARLDELDTNGRDAVLADARAVAAGTLKTLTLVGPVGTGKTSIAAAIALALLDHDQVRWVSVPALVAKMDTRFGSDAREETLQVLHSASALVLDDIDKARTTEAVAMHLFTAIDARTSAGAPLIVTSNLAPAALANRWPKPHGEAIVSRLAGGVIRLVDGRDRRLDRGRSAR